MTVDVHAHCVPEGLLATLQRDRSYGIEVTEERGQPQALIAGRVRAGPIRNDLSDLRARLAAMDRAGVEVQLLSSWIDLTAYALEPRAATRYARMFNELLAATAGTEPQRLRALATVPLQDPAAAARELRHAVSALGMVGAEIATTVDGRELDEAELDPFWDAAAELGCLVLLHPYAALQGRKVQRYFLNNLVGRPAETTIAIAHLILSGVLDRFPGLELCVVHGGGFLPYQLGRLHRGFGQKPELAGRHASTAPAEAARRLRYDSVVHSPEALGFLINLVGADRILLGSDYPFEMGDPDPVASVKAVRGLSADQQALILRGNAAGILSRAGSPLPEPTTTD